MLVKMAVGCLHRPTCRQFYRIGWSLAEPIQPHRLSLSLKLSESKHQQWYYNPSGDLCHWMQICYLSLSMQFPCVGRLSWSLRAFNLLKCKILRDVSISHVASARPDFPESYVSRQWWIPGSFRKEQVLIMKLILCRISRSRSRCAAQLMPWMIMTFRWRRRLLEAIATRLLTALI